MPGVQGGWWDPKAATGKTKISRGKLFLSKIKIGAHRFLT